MTTTRTHRNRTGLWEGFFPSGKLHRRGHYNLDGNWTGYWEGFYTNGKLHWRGQHQNGGQTGYWEVFFDNGKLYSKGYYNQNNLKYGPWVEKK